MHRQSLKSLIAALLCLLVAGCCAVSSGTPASSATLPPVRFLLSFDDGPSPAAENNPTAKIADTLAFNTVQPKIKALFFVQTRWPGAGGSPQGQVLLQRLIEAGHLLELHSGSMRGHISHPKMSLVELETSLADGRADIKAVTGAAPDLVRPPYWEFNDVTRAAYRRAGLEMLTADVSARDGSAMLFQNDPLNGGRIACDLACVRRRLETQKFPIVDGVAPIVVLFHDPNRYTAKHLPEYLRLLLDSARQAGLKPADPPFYTKRSALHAAALVHARFSGRGTPRVLKECNE